MTLGSSWENTPVELTKEASRLLTALNFFYIVEPDFLQDCTDFNHWNCNTGKCWAGTSDTPDMNDFETMTHSPKTEEKETPEDT